MTLPSKLLQKRPPPCARALPGPPCTRRRAVAAWTLTAFPAHAQDPASDDAESQGAFEHVMPDEKRISPAFR